MYLSDKIRMCRRTVSENNALGLALVPVCGLWVDTDEAGRLLEALWAKAFDQLQLLSVEKRPVLFSPLHYASRPACVQTCNMSTTNILCVVWGLHYSTDLWNSGIFKRHGLSILCISHLTATLKSCLFLKLVTATDVNTSLILYILSESYTLKVHPWVWKFYFILIKSLHIHVWNISTNTENIFQSGYQKVP